MDTAPALMELTFSCLFSPTASYLLLTLVDESHLSVQSAFIHMSFFGRYEEVPTSQMGRLSFGVTCSGSRDQAVVMQVMTIFSNCQIPTSASVTHYITHLIPSSIFQDEEIEVSYPMSWADKRLHWDLNPDGPVPASMLLATTTRLTTARCSLVPFSLPSPPHQQSNLISQCALHAQQRASHLCSFLLNFSKALSPFLLPSCPSHSGQSCFFKCLIYYIIFQT